MEVINYSEQYSIPSTTPHAACFPKNIFCVIAGSTGCGKTNLMINLLLQPNLLNYSDVYIYSSTLHQPAYQYLKQCVGMLEALIRNKTNQVVKIGHFFDSDADLIDPNTLDKDKNHVMIFDDVMLEDQSVIKKYFCSGRHNNVNVFYLVQSLHKITKHCIRQNSNIFILFKQDDKTLKYFHETHISGDMDFKEFKQFCDKAWDKKYGFVVINIWDQADFGRYWNNYANVYTPAKYQVK
jgi:hypothetical protein